MAQTVADLMVEIGVDVSGIQRGVSEATSTIDSMGTSVSEMAKSMGENVQGFSNKWGMMSSEMQSAYKDAQSVLNPFKQDLLEVEYGFFKLSQGMGDYKGTTAQFMNELNSLGSKHKKITDNMMKNNDFMKAGFIEGIATMQARSTASEKIAQNFDKMNNPLYKLNNGFLKISQGMENMAKKGTPVYLALQKLGPNANMKDLNDQIKLINGGLLRMAGVALIAAGASVLVYGALHEASKSIPGYSESIETMMSTIREAFQPMVEIFAAVMMKVFEFVTAVAALVVKFNEAHPMIALIIQGFLMLLPALFLILAPLAIGIGLFGGLSAAFAAIAPIIMPIVAGFMSIAGTVLLVAGIIVGLIAVLYLLWTKTTWFSTAVIAVWEAIKSGTQAAWDFILNGILIPIWDALVSFGQEILAKFSALWDEHGATIMAIVEGFMSYIWKNIQSGMKFIQGIFQVVWPVISGLVKIAWGLIKTAISTGVDIITGLIDAGMSLLEGDWEGAWDAIKGIAEDIWNNIEAFFEGIDLAGIGSDIIQGLIDGLGSMAGAISDKVASLAELVPDGLKDFLGIHSPSRVVKALMKWVPIGAAEGIESGLGVVEKSVQRLSETATPDIKDIKTNIEAGYRAPDSNNSIYSSNGMKSNSNQNGNQGGTIQINLDGRTIGEATFDTINDLLGKDIRMSRPRGVIG
ncbi:hypothetical protein Q8G35_12485 [Peribacillus simplex]|uniref:Phage tail tape measure protein n=2 Tax=Peribacillus TaxID=2675229 RepID=A0AA90PAK6_9BACI|nr:MULTISPECIES: hypothetical protein [Peribacillus]MDP1419228.1 hypothetical protein [Peribacillus simplex]MDP1452134.1 hypothetical protein [Peribacillus frigoritolerans]